MLYMYWSDWLCVYYTCTSIICETNESYMFVLWNDSYMLLYHCCSICFRRALACSQQGNISMLSREHWHDLNKGTLAHWMSREHYISMLCLYLSYSVPKANHGWGLGGGQGPQRGSRRGMWGTGEALLRFYLILIVSVALVIAVNTIWQR